MTSTEPGVHGGRSSSRVLRPPGGGSSNIFGHADPTPVSKDNDAEKVEEQTLPDPEPEKELEETENIDESNEESEEVKPTEPPAEPEAAVNDSPVVSSKDSEVNAKKGRGGSSGFNPITGEPYDKTSVTESPKMPGRVRQPPGGASSKLW